MSGKRMLAWVAALGIGGASGCVCIYPVDRAPVARVHECKSLHKCSRDHVYIFLVHGLDPFNWANLNGVRDYLHDLGFTKTYYGQMYHTRHFERELRRIHQEDPEARFVLIGFSFGANLVRNVTNAVKDEGIFIDLLVYLGGNTLEDVPRDRPENVGMLVNVLASGCVWNGATFPNAENLHVVDVYHFGSPTHHETLGILTRELAVVAGRVPVPEPGEVPMVVPEER